LPKILITVTVPETLYYFFTATIKELTKQNFQVFAVCSKSTWISIEQVQIKHGIPLYIIPFSRTFSILSDTVAFVRLCVLIIKIRPDILYTSTPKASALSLLAGKLCNIPLRVYMNRGIAYCDKGKFIRVFYQTIERCMAFCAHHVIAVSRSNLEYLITHKVCDRKKISILCNGSSTGVDCAVFNPNTISTSQCVQLKNSLHISHNAFVFGFVGRLVNDKGINELLIAWKEVSKKIKNVVLIIIGPKLEPHDSISDKTYLSLSNSRSIKLTGAIQNTVLYYSIMDVLVHPSHREGFPNVVLEAAAMGLPVITTDALGCVDSVRDGETGFIVPVKNTEKLAEKMLSLSRDAELRNTMGTKARQWVFRDFNPEAITLELVRLLKSRLTLN